MGAKFEFRKLHLILSTTEDSFTVEEAKGNDVAGAAVQTISERCLTAEIVKERETDDDAAQIYSQQSRASLPG